MLAPVASRRHFQKSSGRQSLPAKRSPRRMFFEPLEARHLLTNQQLGFNLYGQPPSEISGYGSIPITRDGDDFSDTVTIQYTVSGTATKGSDISKPGVDHDLMSGTAYMGVDQSEVGLTTPVKLSFFARR